MQESAQQATASSAEQKIRDATASFRTLSDERSQLERRVQGAADPTAWASAGLIGQIYSALGAGSRVDVAREKAGGEFEKIASSVLDIMTQIKEGEAAKYGAEQSAADLRAQRGVKAIDRGTLNTTGMTRKITDWTAQGVVDSAEQNALAPLLQQLDEVTRSNSAAMRNAIRNWMEQMRKDGPLTADILKQAIATSQANSRALADASNANRLAQ